MKAEATSYLRLREHLSYLGLTAAAENLSAELDRGLKGKLSATQVLETLLGAEVVTTKARRARGRLRFAQFPVHTSLTDCDFDYQPNLDRKLIVELSTLRFVGERPNVILLGPPGVGKSHLAIALGIMVTEAGYQAYFTSAADMVSNLQTAHLAGSALYKLRTYLKSSVLVIDEVGYLPLDQSSASWIFKVVSPRYEKSSPSSSPPTAASPSGARSSPTRSSPPLVDHLIDNAIAINIRRRATRMRGHQDSSNAKNGRP